MKKLSSLAALLACSVAVGVAGCKPPAAVTAGEESKVNPGGTGKVGQAAPATTGGQATPTDPNAQPNATGKGGVPTMETTVDTSGAVPVDKAKGMLIKASEGGVYVSEDGLLKATIPPGALSQDTEVRFHRVDTQKMKNTNVFLNGIQFQMDLGDAVLMPDQKITVAAKADDRLIGELKAMYEDYDPARYALSQDAQGTWNVVMPVYGPQKSADANMGLTPGPDRGLMMEGVTPLPPKVKNGFFKDTRIEAFCAYGPPPLKASYGNCPVKVEWLAESQSTKNGAAAHGSGANAVKVSFSTNPVHGYTGPQYKEVVVTPARAAIPETRIDAKGRLYGPSAAVQGDAEFKAAFNAEYAKVLEGKGLVTVDLTKLTETTPANKLPTTPTWLAAGGTPAETTQKVYDAIPARAEVKEWQPLGNDTDLTLSNGRYSFSGHRCDDSSCTGPVIVVQDDPIIESGYAIVYTDTNGIATTRALLSYNSRNCNSHGCHGGPVDFTLSSQAEITAPTGIGSNLVSSDGTPYRQDPIRSDVKSWDTGRVNAGTDKITHKLRRFSPYIVMSLKNKDGIAYSEAGSPTENADLEIVVEGQLLTRTGDTEGGAVTNTKPFKWEVSLAGNETAARAGGDLLLGKYFRSDDFDFDAIDGVRFVKVEKIYAHNLRLVGDAKDIEALGNVPVQVNGGYDWKIKMVANSPK